MTLQRKVTKRSEKPTGDGWKLIHAWANPTDGALWLWQRPDPAAAWDYSTRSRETVIREHRAYGGTSA